MLAHVAGVPVEETLLMLSAGGTAVSLRVAMQMIRSGGGGIRTRGPRERTPVFKTGAFDRSATPPGASSS